MRFRRFIIAIGVCLVVFALSFVVRRLRRSGPVPAVAIEGNFVRNGEYPGAPLSLIPTPRTWGSWAGNDANEGTLRMGPFPAPARLSLALSGYPHHAGNDLYLELVGVGARLPLEIGDIGERWQVKEFEIPFGWEGWPVTLVAVDQSHDPGGWLAVSELLPPAAVGDRVIEGDFPATLAAFLCNGLLLALGLGAAARWLERQAWLPAPWVALAAGGIVALAGYAGFWLYFVHPLVGRWYSLLLCGGALVSWIRAAPGSPADRSEWRTVLALLGGIGLFYVALLHLFAVDRSFYDLAANRFVPGLPGDNRLAHDIAIRLYHGQSLKQLSVDWLSSDRPPLQSGWQLLTWPVTALLGFGATTASGTSAMWFQLLWVAAAYGLLRTLGLDRPRALALTAALSLSGFFLQNTVFTWPKLAAAAFTCGAWALWLQPASGARSRSRLAAGAALAALAWLSHGGIAFSLLPLAPWLAWRALRGGVRDWLPAGAIFLALAIPWLAYQKFYDPPGNRLLKWHLAGQHEIDSRGVGETIHASYAALSWRQIVTARVANFRTQVQGDWRLLGTMSLAHAAERKNDEFYHSARALAWWLFGVVALGWVALNLAVRRRLPGTLILRHQIALLSWILASTVAWCLLLFTGGDAVIILGSYATMLAAFVLLAGWIAQAGPCALVAVVLLQAATLATTWAVPNAVVHGPVSLGAFSLAVAAVAGVGWFVARAFSLSSEAVRPTDCLR